jgi:hypothetical protein
VRGPKIQRRGSFSEGLGSETPAPRQSSGEARSRGSTRRQGSGGCGVRNRNAWAVCRRVQGPKNQCRGSFSEGSFVYADAADTLQLLQTKFSLADTMLDQLKKMVGVQRTRLQVAPLNGLPPVQVEPSSGRLSVALVTSERPAGLRLRAGRPQGDRRRACGLRGGLSRDRSLDLGDTRLSDAPALCASRMEAPRTALSARLSMAAQRAIRSGWRVKLARPIGRLPSA